MEESEDLLKLGLLFGQELDPETEDLPEVLSFQHKLIQEYFAALFIAEQCKTDRSFLQRAFQTLQDATRHHDVLRFTSGHLESCDASLVTNHIAQIAAVEIHKGLNGTGLYAHVHLELIQEMLPAFHKEGSVSTINQYLCIYPACGHPLSDAITSSQLVIITDVNESDPLHLANSQTKVIVNIKGVQKNTVERLMAALALAHINLQGIVCDIVCSYTYDITSFPQLKQISFDSWLSTSMMHEKQISDLTDSINSLEPEPQIRVLQCCLPTLHDRKQALTLLIPFIKALNKCSHLHFLSLTGDVGDFLRGLMGIPPPQLKVLFLAQPCINADNILESMANAVKRQKLEKLEGLALIFCQISKPALTSLVKTFIASRPDTKLDLILDPDVLSPELESLCRPTKIRIFKNMFWDAANLYLSAWLRGQSEFMTRVVREFDPDSQSDK